jgi:hypothetical protein
LCITLSETALSGNAFLTIEKSEELSIMTFNINMLCEKMPASPVSTHHRRIWEILRKYGTPESLSA